MSFLNHYFRLLVPIGLLFFVLVMREVLPLTINRYLVGINFVLAGFIISGRFQYVQYIVLGNRFKAFTNYFEYVPIGAGIFGYVLSQFLVFQEFKKEFGLISLLNQAFELSQILPELKFVYLVLLNVDLFLLVRQFEIVGGIKGRTRIERSVLRVHWIVTVGFIWRLVSFLGGFIGSFALYNAGMLLTLVVLGVLLVSMLFFTIDDLPNWSHEAKEIEESQSDLWNNWRRYFSETKPFLSKSLQMQDVANHLNVREAELRAALQLNSSLNFSELVNVYRLHYLINLDPPEFKKAMSSEEMADACGFNSRSTLFRTSKKWLNISASQIELGKITFNLEEAISKNR